MDKKSIIGIAVVAVLFLGFAYFNSQQQKEYLEQKAAYEAYVDSVAAAARAAAPIADSVASGNGVQAGQPFFQLRGMPVAVVDAAGAQALLPVALPVFRPGILPAGLDQQRPVAGDRKSVV